MLKFRIWILSALLMMPFCKDGVYERIELPKIFPGAQMPIYSCYHDLDQDGYPDIVLIFAGEGEEKTVIKAFLPHEYIDALEPEEER